MFCSIGPPSGETNLERERERERDRGRYLFDEYYEIIKCYLGGVVLLNGDLTS